MGIGVYAAALFGTMVAATPIPLQPIPWRDPAPLGRLFLQQPFEAPRPEDSGLSVQILSANLLMKGGRAGGFEYTVDEEIASFSLTGQLVLAKRWGLSVSVPLVLQYGGWLDPVIDGVEKLLGASSARRGTTSFQTVVRFATPGGPVLERDGPSASIGDVTLGAQGWLVKQSGFRPALALRAALKAPTGGPLVGSGTWDVGGGLLAGWEAGFFAAHLAFDVALPTGRLRVLDLATRPYASVQVGLGFRVDEAVALHLQLSGHTPPLRVDDAPGLSESTFYILAGTDWQLAPGTSIALSMAENFLSPGRGADFSVLLGLRLTPGAAGGGGSW
ncbi:MAG TPA: DUF3187 family protein [Myxococcaceae bacterium]|nr:DUF3187 family protein [Myxococcaceae bacterium]